MYFKESLEFNCSKFHEMYGILSTQFRVISYGPYLWILPTFSLQASWLPRIGDIEVYFDSSRPQMGHGISQFDRYENN